MREELTDDSIGGMPPAERDRRARMIASELRALDRRHKRQLSDAFLQELAETICEWTPGGKLQRPPRRSREADARELRFYHQLGRDMDAIAERLQSPGVSEFLGSWLVPEETLTVWKAHLDRMRDVLTALPKKLQRKQGPQVDQWRVLFAGHCGEILIDHGLPTARSRSGLFADVLRVALEAAGERVPEDVFDLVDQALAQIERDARTMLWAVRVAAEVMPELVAKESLETRQQNELLTLRAHRVLASLSRRTRVVVPKPKRRRK